MMLNIVLGAGLLTLPGLAAEAAGPAAIGIWAICALAALPLLAVFAILGRSYPDAGGLAAFLHRAFGDPGNACATFLFLGAVAVGLPAIALTGGHYAAAAIGGPAYAHAALLIVAALLANLVSSETASRINAALASVILVILVAIAAVGWHAVDPGWDAVAMPAELPEPTVLGATFMMVFFAFTGWEVSANLGGEFKNPARDFPLAMGLSFAVAVALYLTLAVIAVAAGPAGAGAAPFAAIFGQEFGPRGTQVVSFVSVLLIFANLSAAIWAVSRMVYAAAREGLMPRGLSYLGAGVPMRAVALTVGVLLAVIGLSASGVLDLGKLLGEAGQNFLLLYAGAAAALIRLSPRALHKALGWACLAMVAAILVYRGAGTLLYPAILVFLGLVVAFLRNQTEPYDDPQPQQPPESA